MNHPIPSTLLLSAMLSFAAPISSTADCCLTAATQVKQSDAYKAMLNIFTYDADGKLLANGTGFFISSKGEAASQYALFDGAYRAEAVDFKGNRYSVSRILGANRDYDLVRFSLEGVKKCEAFSISPTACADGASLEMVRYATNKKTAFTPVSIIKQEPYADYSYYTVSAANEAAHFALPLVDEAGNLVAIVQKNVGKDAQSACAIDSRFISKLNIQALSAINRDLRAIHITKALPSEPGEALNYIYMLPSSDSLALSNAYADFIAAYPQMPDGYLGRAALHAAKQQYAKAETDLQTALEKASDGQSSDSITTTDAIHYQFSNLMLRSLTQSADSASLQQQGWTLQRALDEAEKAYQTQPLPLYVMQQGKCLLAMKRYAEAHEKYLAVTHKKGFDTSENFYLAARSLELASGDAKEVIVLLDSAIQAIPRPVNARNAQYFLKRSQRLLLQKRYRDAVMDYNEYEKAVGPRNLTDRFYYLRYEAETQAHMYQQALDDIRTAISSSASPLPYRLEEALFLLRIGEFQQALTAATELLKELPENPDCYKIIGIAYGEMGKKQPAQQNLQKAKSLGDTTVDTFIQKYK